MNRIICCFIYFLLVHNICAMESREILVLENHMANKKITIINIKNVGSSVISRCDIGTEVEKEENQRLQIVVPSTGCDPNNNFITLLICDDSYEQEKEVTIRWGRLCDGIYADKYGDIDESCWLVKRTEKGPIVHMIFDDLEKRSFYEKEAVKLREQSLPSSYIQQCTGI